LLAFGQYMVCSLLTAVWIEDAYNVSSAFAAVVPLGFEGGHGVVAGFKESFDADYPAG
jgi:Na+/glutamate symporter